MSGGKSRKQKVENEVTMDPDIKRAAGEQLRRAETIASMGAAPNLGPTIAAFTPQQRAAMTGANEMAAALGLPTGNPQFGNAQWVGDSGFKGHSVRPAFEEAKASLPEGFEDALNTFFEQLRQSGQQEGWGSGGGAGGKNEADLPYNVRYHMNRQGRGSGEPGGEDDHGRSRRPSAPLAARGTIGDDAGRGRTAGRSIGGYTSIGDMFDGGGPGQSGDRHRGGGFLSDYANARRDRRKSSGGRSGGGN